MRLRHPQTILCISFLIQVTFTYQKNDNPKNNPRTNPKKYYPTSISARISTSTSKNIDNKYSFDSSTVKLRHSSKFPHLDKLKSRIADLDNSDTGANNVRARSNSDLSPTKNRYSDNKLYSSYGRLSFSDPYPRLRHHGWSNRIRTTTTTTTTTSPDDDLFDTYGDMEEDYDEDKMEDDSSNYADFFDTLEDTDEEIDNSFQAEEPTERPTTPEPRKYASLTEYKWQQLGTYEKVQEARRTYLNLQKSPEENNATAVLEHYVRVKNQYQCKKPIPKVIPVHLEHPDPTVTYIPQCTVLHRCAEDTGCCKWDATCQYKERQEVSLYFYVKNIGADYTRVKSLTFYNHTECECKDKKPENSEESSPTERSKRVADNSNEEDRNVKLDNGIFFKSGTNFRSNVPENLQIKCKCPKEFTPKVKYSSKCYCDCKEDNEDCIRMKKGKEYSALTDRLCILNKQCGTVSCEYGPYIKEKGRCPRINEV